MKHTTTMRIALLSLATAICLSCSSGSEGDDVIEQIPTEEEAAAEAASEITAENALDAAEALEEELNRELAEPGD